MINNITFPPQSSYGDWKLNVASGTASGYKVMNKFGRNPDIDNNGSFETLWNGGQTYAGHNATNAEPVKVWSNSTNDVGREVHIFGLDADWNEILETITITGTTEGTAAISTLSFIRMDEANSDVGGSESINSGLITVQQATSGIVFAKIPVGYNTTMVACYSIPAGKTGWIQDYGVFLSGKISGISEVRLVIREFGKQFRVVSEVSILGSGLSGLTNTYLFYRGPIPEKADIQIIANSDTQNLGVAGSFTVLLVDNN